MADQSRNGSAGSVPALSVEEILVDVAHSVVEAQQTLDAASLASEVRVREQGLDKFGLAAHWYTIPELTFDLRLAFEIGDRGELKTEMVDAEYQSKYGFNLQASSLLRTRIVATPPAEAEGLSLLDAGVVLKRVDQIKKLVEAYGRADAPHFVLHYRPFAPQGYAGGLWYVLLLDTQISGEILLRGLVVVDDASSQVVRLWTDEPITIQGVTFTAEEATRAINLANTASEETLRSEVGLTSPAVTNILAARPFVGLQALSEVQQVGPVALQKLRDYQPEEGQSS